MLSYDKPVLVDGHKAAAAAAAVANITPAASDATMTSSLSNNTTSASTRPSQTHKHHHIWLVTGPAGCGKTSVAEFLANALEMPYIEGDSFHPPANVEKMSHGIPLTDADRWDWLTALREESMHQLNAGSEGVILTCSALKRKYRDVIRVAGYYDANLLIHFIYLDASEEVLLQRVSLRQGHFMGANMVHSQFESLERPSEDERDVICVDVSGTLEEVKSSALEKAVQTMKDDL